MQIGSGLSPLQKSRCVLFLVSWLKSSLHFVLLLLMNYFIMECDRIFLVEYSNRSSVQYTTKTAGIDIECIISINLVGLSASSKRLSQQSGLNFRFVKDRKRRANWHACKAQNVKFRGAIDKCPARTASQTCILIWPDLSVQKNIKVYLWVVRLVVTGGSLTRIPKGHFAVSWSRYLNK